MTTERIESITSNVGTVETPAADGATTADGWLWVPASGTGPGILLLQEIFGVGPFLRDRAAKLADLGYVVLCPDLFWRTERHVAHAHDEAGIEAAYASMGRWQAEVDDATTAGDLLAALDHLRSLPETAGRPTAAMGYCLGGRLAYEVAVAGEPDALVSYYGSGIGLRLEDADQVRCPALFHFGAADPFIALEEAEAVEAAFAARDDVEVVIHDGAGHAFENGEAAMFHHPEAAAVSWARTTDWLARTVV